MSTEAIILPWQPWTAAYHLSVTECEQNKNVLYVNFNVDLNFRQRILFSVTYSDIVMDVLSTLKTKENMILDYGSEEKRNFE